MDPPGPAIGFLQECLRFYDHALKEIDNGLMDEPKLRAFLSDAMRPNRGSVERTGAFLAQLRASPNVTTEIFHPTADGRLAVEETDTGLRLVPVTHVVGLEASDWCGYGGPLDNPSDQRSEDAASLVFDSAPLSEDLPILGRPQASLVIESDELHARVAVRLCDIWPDGASTLISRGMLNLSHRRSHEHPEPLEPGRTETVVVELDATGYRLPAGHKLRMAVSSGHWPMMWPAPKAAQPRFALAEPPSRIPVRRRPADDSDAVPEHSRDRRRPPSSSMRK